MKKGLLFILGAAFIASMSFTSCKKDYTCSCTTKFEFFGTTTSTSASTIIHDTKSKAKTACEGTSVETSYGSTTCEIK